MGTTRRTNTHESSMGLPSPLKAQHLQRTIPPWKLSGSANCSRSIFSARSSALRTDVCSVRIAVAGPVRARSLPDCTLPSGCLQAVSARRQRVRVPAQRRPWVLVLWPGPALPCLSRRTLDRAAWPSAASETTQNTTTLTNVCIRWLTALLGWPTILSTICNPCFFTAAARV